MAAAAAGASSSCATFWAEWTKSGLTRILRNRRRYRRVVWVLEKGRKVAPGTFEIAALCASEPMT